MVPEIPCGFRRNNAIFVHVPKAAGSTINLCLFGHRIGHRSIDSYWQADPDFTEQAFKFTFVRHPYFRFVSAYYYILSGGMSSRDAHYIACFPEEFSSLQAFAEASVMFEFRKAIPHLRPQHEYVSLPAGAPYKVFMDYVGKTEFLNEHIDILTNLLPEALGPRLALAKKTKFNSGKSRGHKVDVDVFQRIRRIYESDFELFGYDEWGTPEKAEALVSAGS